MCVPSCRWRPLHAMQSVTPKETLTHSVRSAPQSKHLAFAGSLFFSFSKNAREASSGRGASFGSAGPVATPLAGGDTLAASGAAVAALGGQNAPGEAPWTW